jgi:opacity protein-like surface antigen
MKVLFGSAAAVVLAAAAPAIASAQTATPNTGVYGTLGYANTHDSDLNLGTIQGRLGYRFNDWLGVEGELAGGVKSDDINTTVAGANVTGKAKIEHQEAIYGVGFLPLNANWDLLGRVGYGHTKAKVSDVTVTGAGGTVSNLSSSGDGDSWNFGVGAQYHWDGQNGVRADYTREEFRDNGAGHADVWSLAYSRKF